MQTFEEIKTYLLQHATDFLFRVIFALLIIFVGWKLVKWLLKILDKGKLFSKLDSTVRSFFSSTVGIVLKVLLVVSAAIVLGIPESSFLTLLASGGVAVGLALQGSLSNFAGGLMLLIFKPFKEGDYIKTADNEGTVISVNVFYTVIRTVENQHYQILFLRKKARCNMSITPTLHRIFHRQLLCLFSSSCSCSFSFFCSSSFRISCTIFCATSQSCISDLVLRYSA